MSLTKVSYSMINGAEFNVLDYGADPSGVADSTAAIQAAIDAAHGSTVYIPSGIYKTTNQINLHPSVTLLGEGYPFPVSAYNPTQQYTGTVLNKLHNGSCIVVQGTVDNSESAGINGITIISNLSTYPTGDGIRIDRVSAYFIENCNIWSCGGNGFTIGVSTGDVTGNNTLRNCYVNNCGGSAYYVRSKWFLGSNIKSDGCDWGLYSNNSPESCIENFHFEGMTEGGVHFVNSNGNSVLKRGFISLTNNTALYGVYAGNIAGNGSFVFDSVHIIADTAASVSNVGFTLPSATWETKITNCQIEGWKVAIANSGSYNSFVANSFVDCVLPMQEQGAYTKITNNSTISTSGSYAIDHLAGQGYGIWSENWFDKPLKATAGGGSNGNFLQNIVVNNTGFITQKRGLSGSISSGATIAHGLSCTPYIVLAQSTTGNPTALTITFDATNITLTWTGGGSYIFAWEAYAVCATVG